MDSIYEANERAMRRVRAMLSQAVIEDAMGFSEQAQWTVYAAANTLAGVVYRNNRLPILNAKEA